MFSLAHEQRPIEISIERIKASASRNSNLRVKSLTEKKSRGGISSALYGAVAIEEQTIPNSKAV
jgi:hypothetical protein